jgi:VWFA-related protein
MPDNLMPAKKHWLISVACCTFFWLPAIGHCKEPKDNPPKDATTFHSKVDVVLVPVLVKDNHGAAVGDLSQRDFEVFDNKKHQEITAFMVAANSNVQFTKSSGRAVPGALPVLPRRFVVFLIDDLHINFVDLARAREAAKSVVSSLSEGEIAAVISLSGVVNSGLTADRQALKDAIATIRPQSLYRATGTDCPDMDFYEAELIVNERNSVALQAATDEVLDCNPSLKSRNVAENLADSTARRVFEMGEQDSRVSFASLRELVNKTAALPGLTTVILVSPGFLTAAARDQQEESQIIDTAAVSNITINVLDPRGVYSSEGDAGDRGAGSAHMNQLRSEYRRAALLQSDNIGAELANGTGGTFVHNTNDLQAGLKALASPPEFLYLLEFHAHDLKRDNSYHRLKVKVDRKGVRVQARRGYFAARPAKTSAH